MKLISYVEDVRLLSIQGAPMQDETGKPASLSQRQFILLRIADAVFTQGKNGMDAVFFAVAAKKEIDAQTDDAVVARSGWLIEDDRAAALLASTKNPTGSYNP